MKLFSRLFAAVCYLLMAVLAVSTFCSPAVYSSLWFAALWAFVGVGLAVLMVHGRLWRRPGLFVLHLSFIVILLGGLITRLTSREGVVILAEGGEESVYVQRDGTPVDLGFTVGLNRFETLYYPGGEIARDYVSHITVDGDTFALSVNKPLAVGGVRLYQNSYMDERTSVIGVRSDAAGTRVTFAGYAMFLLGGLMCMFRRRALRRAVPALLLLLSVAQPASASASVPVLSAHDVDSLARRQVLYQGRTVTVSTVCYDVLQKVYGSRSYKGLSAERAVLSFQAFPREWASQPLISHGDGYVSLQECFDSEGRYTLAGDAAADERAGVLLLLMSGELMHPAEQSMSSAKVEAELLYNRVPFTLIIFITLFVCAGLSFFRKSWARGLAWPAIVLQAAVIGVECWLTGHGPFASMFETLQLLAVVTTALALLVPGVMSVGLLAAGSMSLVAHLQAANPMVTPLMPVLHSPWLSMHVTLVMTAYALLVVGSLTAAVGMVDRRRARVCCAQALRLIRPGVFLLGLGIFSGAVWADVSWGRYWGWDPKETWALVTFMLYAVPLHRRGDTDAVSPLWLAAPVLSIVMTYFGVNYLPSLHAYS